MTKVYVLMNWQRGVWVSIQAIVGVFATMEAAEKQMQEYKEDGLDVAGMHIEEYEVNQ